MWPAFLFSWVTFAVFAVFSVRNHRTFFVFEGYK